MKFRKWIKGTVLAIAVITSLTFSLSFFPHKVISIESENVSKITIFDGNTGEEMEITDKKAMNPIIHNLNSITFQKGKPSFGYMGYSFRTTIYSESGKVLESLIINSSDTIRFNGFFYRAVEGVIDYEYIEEIVK